MHKVYIFHAATKKGAVYSLVGTRARPHQPHPHSSTLHSPPLSYSICLLSGKRNRDSDTGFSQHWSLCREITDFANSDLHLTLWAAAGIWKPKHSRKILTTVAECYFQLKLPAWDDGSSTSGSQNGVPAFILFGKILFYSFEMCREISINTERHFPLGLSFNRRPLLEPLRGKNYYITWHSHGSRFNVEFRICDEKNFRPSAAHRQIFGGIKLGPENPQIFSQGNRLFSEMFSNIKC